ncbi:exodeoxyribonuclease I [Azohydromonas sediminis]|uniref:exodeoxyribonuclease I n=1 Tax=Azohydromonas sediminis TaxID=2259674 RepID=UPI000E65521B|nr:exodeoxyribonuclease I [Azohydromonas sediminis]
MDAFTFFWHDYETFGRDPRRDRPAQFAGVRTDAELNEIAPPVTQYCRPAPDCLPDPESCLLTGITPQHALEHGVSEHDFAAVVEAELAAPDTVGVGYNSIRFDDEVTRFLFWRTLRDPYAREWKNGCGRWDLLDVVRCAYALRPEDIVWPAGDDGRPSFRLEKLTAANGLAHASAHDALADVRATIALARLLRTRKRRLWDFLLARRGRQAVADEIAAAQRSGVPLLHVSGRYPAERGCLALVWPLAPHPVNRNEVIVWDLAEDPQRLAGLDAGEVRARLFTRSEELPDGVERLPLKTIHLNRAPVVIGNPKVLTPAMAERWGVDGTRVERHLREAQRLAPSLAGLWPDVFARPERGEPLDVDEDLYGGFVGDADRRALERLRALPPDELAHRRPAFDDPRLDELVWRWRARNFPATLDADERRRWERHCARRLYDGAGGALTLAAYQERIDALADAHADDARAMAILEALSDWGEQVAPPA